MTELPDDPGTERSQAAAAPSPPAQPPDAQIPDAHPLTVEADWQALEAEIFQPSPGQPATLNPSQLSERIPGKAPIPLALVETAFLASAASLIWLINYYFPLGPVLRIFFPIPIALLYLRWGDRAAWMGALVSGLLLSVLMGPVRSVMYVMPFGFLGVLLGMFWRRGANWGMAVAIGSLLGSLGFFFRIWLISLLLGDDLWTYATTQVTELLEWLFLRLGLLTQPSLWLVQLGIVGLVLANNLVYLFAVHLVALYLLDRLGNPIPRPPKWVLTMLDYE